MQYPAFLNMSQLIPSMEVGSTLSNWIKNGIICLFVAYFANPTFATPRLNTLKCTRM